nr:type I restriction-modification enzyme R subunit C-terminal domain-containing protein [Candidatus Vampirococcus lugosii]
MNFGEYKKYSQNGLKEEVFDMNNLKEIWTNIGKREEFIDKLKEKNIFLDFLKNTDGLEDVDKFDFIAHTVFGAPIISRHERYEKFMLENADKIKNSGEEFAEVVFWMLEKYKLHGEEELSPDVFVHSPDKIDSIKQVYTKER